MTAQLANDCVELRIGPHCARKGWETVRLSYDMHNPRHQRQIEAVLAALRTSRLSSSAAAAEPCEQEEGAGPNKPAPARADIDQPDQEFVPCPPSL